MPTPLASAPRQPLEDAPNTPTQPSAPLRPSLPKKVWWFVGAILLCILITLLIGMGTMRFGSLATFWTSLRDSSPPPIDIAGSETWQTLTTDLTTDADNEAMSLEIEAQSTQLWETDQEAIQTFDTVYDTNGL